MKANMRTIKFRAWDKKNNWMMTDVWGFFIDQLGRIWDQPQDTYDTPNKEIEIYHAQEDFVLMQFTGLKDEKGFEIYEGDIVKGNNQIGTIEWVEIDTCFAVQTYKPEIWTVGKFRERMGNIEVIGNIYENPELL